MPPPIPNGPVCTSVCLACALCYFAGGSPYDIMSAYGVSHTIILDSVWCVVDTVNQLPEFHIEYPRSQAEQKKIAKGFEEKSEVGFTNCAGCIDGLLIWTHKPSEKEAKRAGVGRKNSYVAERVSLVSIVRPSLMFAVGYWISPLYMVEHRRIALHLKEAAYTKLWKRVCCMNTLFYLVTTSI